MRQECTRHKPNGCFRKAPNGELVLRCPFCLIFPILTVLKKITNHLELIKGAPTASLQSSDLMMLSWSA